MHHYIRLYKNIYNALHICNISLKNICLSFMKKKKPLSTLTEYGNCLFFYNIATYKVIELNSSH